MNSNASSNRAEEHPPRVTVYTSSACHWCKVAKAYMRDNEIEFTEVDIVSDKRGRRDMVAMTGQYGVPVIRIGERAMVGWDTDEFKRLFSGTRGRR